MHPPRRITGTAEHTKKKEPKLNGSETKEYCLLKRYNEKTNILNLYYDSFSSLIDDYKNMKSHFYTEIFVVIPLYLLASLINNFSYIFMIRYSDANNILISKNFYYFIKRIIVMIINKGDEKYITIFKVFYIRNTRNNFYYK